MEVGAGIQVSPNMLRLLDRECNLSREVGHTQQVLMGYNRVGCQ